MLTGVILVGLLTLAKLAFVDFIGQPTPFLLYFAAILAAAYTGGLGAGLFTTVVSAVVSVGLFVVRADNLLTHTAPRIIVFLIEGLAISFVTDRFTKERPRARRAAEALEVAREWFQIALRSIGDAVITTDEHGKINSLNPVAEHLTGWSNEEALGKPLDEVFWIIDEDTRQPLTSPVDRVLKERTVVALSTDALLVRQDGNEVSVDDSAAPIISAGGQLRGIILVFRDVSVKRAAQRRQAFLARATAELNSSLDYKTTLATVARLAVPAIADWCAVDILEEGQVKRLAVAHVDPEKARWVAEIERRYPANRDAPYGLRHVLGTGQSEMLREILPELLDRFARDDEHRRLLSKLALRSYIGVPLKHQDQVFGAITLAMAESRRCYQDEDLALAEGLADRVVGAVEKARLYREAQKARLEAVAANRTKDEFLAMLGHELRNPLAPIRTALDLIRLRPGESHDRQHTIIERQVRHLVRLVDDLLDISRITRGRVELARERVDLQDVIERAEEMVWPAGVARAHDVHVDVTPGLTVFGDPVRLSQVVANLLMNSVKYTPAGGNIWIEVQRVGDDRAAIRVRDDGMGIGAEMLRQVFDLFVQDPQALDRSRGGLGLGLAIVRGLVLAHGGTVSAHSEGVGKGALFVVELPLVASSELELAGGNLERPRRRRREKLSP